MKEDDPNRPRALRVVMDQGMNVGECAAWAQVTLQSHTTTEPMSG
jgi:hypothetical protein